jgi:hypothetical protein
MQDTAHPKSGDVVIWDMEPDNTNEIYWVRIQGRSGAAQLFEGADAWTHARVAAEGLAGLNRPVWKRHKDGHFQRLINP